MSKDQKKEPWTREKIQREVISTGLLIFVIFALRSTFFNIYVVPTGSMLPTIVPGDRFIASQYSFGFRLPFSEIFLTDPEPPERGDVVVFPNPRDGVRYVKRAVAVAGDTIEVRNGRIILNGEPVPIEPAKGFEKEDGDYGEYYWETLGQTRHLVRYENSRPSLRYFPAFKVPENMFFFMGDNRDNSADSRFEEMGPGWIRSIQGKGRWYFFFSDFPKISLAKVGSSIL